MERRGVTVSECLGSARVRFCTPSVARHKAHVASLCRHVGRTSSGSTEGSAFQARPTHHSPAGIGVNVRENGTPTGNGGFAELNVHANACGSLTENDLR